MPAMKAITLTSRHLTAGFRSRRAPLSADSAFGMLIFVATEVMFCTALISAFVIIKAGIETRTPPVGVRLLVVGTALSPILLLLSGVLLHQAGRWFATEDSTTLVRTLLGGPAVMGVCFVLVQWYEWMRLSAYGMTMTSGIFGACFYLLITMHGLHAAAAALTIVYLSIRLTRNTLGLDHVRAMQVFWYFVVGIWPV